jgi:hypothetical protein
LTSSFEELADIDPFLVGQNKQEHQVIFQRIGEYATDVEFHHLHIPVPLGLQIQIADQAMEIITKYAHNIYQETLMHYHKETDQSTNWVSNSSPSTITESQTCQTIRVHIWACWDSLCNGQCNQNFSHRESKPTESERITHPDTHCRNTREPSKPPGPKNHGQRKSYDGSIVVQPCTTGISSQQSGIPDNRCSQSSISNHTTGTDEQALDGSCARADYQKNVQLPKHSSTAEGHATVDQKVSGSIPNRTILLLPPRRQSSEPVSACFNSPPKEPAPIFPVGAFPNRKLYQEQYINDAKCQGGHDCGGGRAPISISEPNRSSSMSIIQDLVSALGQTHNQDRPGRNMSGGLTTWRTGKQ